MKRFKGVVKDGLRASQALARRVGRQVRAFPASAQRAWARLFFGNAAGSNQAAPDAIISDQAPLEWSGSETEKRKIVERLNAFSNAFAERSAGVEDGFLKLGRTLRSLYTSATDLAKLVGERTTALGTALTESHIGGADGLAAHALSELRSGLERTSGSLEALEKVGRGLARLRAQAQSIEGIGLFLKSGVFNFAIESARTAEYQQALGSFIDELRSLAAKIGEVAEDITDQIQTTKLLQARGRESIRSNLREMQRLARILEPAAHATSAQAQKLLDGSSGALKKTEEHTRHIAAEANVAVYHLQFGDIVRQKLEHITEALKKASDLLKNAGSQTEFGAGVAQADCVIVIQVGQLELIRQEIADAERKLAGAFENIARETGQLLEALNDPLWAESNGGAAADALDALKIESLRLDDLKNQSQGIQEHACQTAKQAVEGSAQLAGHLDQVGVINREMHLQALNAIIKTTSLGANGAALEVLSMEVDRLFRQSNQAVSEIVATLELVRSDAQLVESRNRAGHHAAAETASSDSQLRSGLDRLTGAYAEFRQTSAQASALTEKQAGVLDESREALQFLATLAQTLAKQAGDLTQLRQVLAPWKPATAGLTSAAASADQHYTMQSERDVHRTVSRELLAQTDPNMPQVLAAPADNQPGTVSNTDGTNTESALGDNVELF